MFAVGLGKDFISAEGPSLLRDAPERYFDSDSGVEYTYFGQVRAEVRPDEIREFDGLISLWQPFTRASFEGVERLATIARWGVGYDMIDIDACTDNDVLVSITRDSVRRPVAEGILTFVLALAKGIGVKDRIVREGGWMEERAREALGLRGKVLGSIGIGNIGAELFRLVRPLGFGRLLAYDPFVLADDAESLGVELAELETVLAESDFVCLNCPLVPETHHLVDESRLRRMKSTAYLINTARGPIVDERALYRALTDGWIAGAALDVFEEEPLPQDSRLRELDNVLLSPHAMAWTDELYEAQGREACENVLTVLQGNIPPHVVNPDVTKRPAFRRKLDQLRERHRTIAVSERSPNA